MVPDFRVQLASPTGESETRLAELKFTCSQDNYKPGVNYRTKELLHNFDLPSVKITRYQLNHAGAKLACGFANSILTWRKKI